MHLPNEIKKHVSGMKVDQNEVGYSSANVYRFYDENNSYFLKINDANDEFKREVDLLDWLEGKLPVPKIICRHEEKNKAYLLMAEIQGHMCCVVSDDDSDTIREPHGETIKRLAEGLLKLQAVDITHCPFDSTLNHKLKQSLYNIENNLVDVDGWEDFNKFKSPMELYDWLVANKPQEDLCFTHGDYCLPNIFINDTCVTGFIDMGHGGVADKYQDIALCVRSIAHNAENLEQVEIDKFNELLFSHLGITPDWDKIHYYILLDDLF
ncbi:MAG: aminoglycoside 3'-phosphotransferase [Defluviitaleaceae bacterium]|nr:aminoglycoside 3'-phosphotransferase [Defluviitaleaceae bacterium]